MSWIPPRPSKDPPDNWFTGMACTAVAMRIEDRRERLRDALIGAGGLHDGAWFIAQGRKYADEANRQLFTVAKWVCAGLVLAGLAWRYL